MGGVIMVFMFITTAFMILFKFSVAKLVLIMYVHNSEDCFGSEINISKYL